MIHDKTEVHCNCISPFFNNNDKIFLTRKRQLQDNQFVGLNRRVNKSAELKSQSEPKVQKKSLKKRPTSNVQTEVQNFQQSIRDINKFEEEIKINNPPEQPLMRLGTYHHLRGRESPVLHHQQPHIQPQPARQPQIQNRPRVNSTYNNQPMSKDYQNPLIAQTPINNPIYYQTSHYPNIQKPQPQIISRPPPIQIPNFGTLRNYPTYSMKQIHDMNPPYRQQPMTAGNFVQHHNYGRQQPHITSLNNYSDKFQDWERESETDSLMIQEFSRLLNKDQNTSQKIQLQSSRNSLRPREAQKSKRFQKQQQIFGRLAESDDDNCSESVPSEVIGKGFDRTYQDFEEGEQIYRFEQTMATRSTNTKLSQLNSTNKNDSNFNEQHYRDKFGNNTHFKSYKWL